ncbi:MAG: MIP family channel protein [Armatimonadota bacterium]|nr:MIP family channel protein [bacterium]
MPSNDQTSVDNMMRASVAEFVGTFILVFAGTSVATSAILDRPIAGLPLNSLAVGLTFGLVLVALISALGHISGAHFNPAVTLGLFSIGRFPGKYVVSYIIAQIAGAIAASAAVWATFGDAARSQAFLAATYPTATASEPQAFLMEVIITFILLFTIVSISTDERANTTTASLAIGFALGVGVLIGGPVSGGSVNPARTLGPMIMSGNFTSVWVYLAGPLVGAIVAALMYHYFIFAAKAPSSESQTRVIGRTGEAGAG